MQMKLPEQLDEAQALRYLGMKDREPDAATRILLDRCRAELFGAVQPRFVYREIPRSALQNPAYGQDLAQHLAGCSAALLLAVTLGTGADTLLRRLSASDLAAAAVADAQASALVEQLADSAEQTLRTLYAQKGLFLTGRYSPGYGDCPLSLQTELCLLLDTQRSIGVAPTEQNLMMPRKTITAVLGAADRPVHGHRAGCAHCALRQTCAYRKRGTTCAEE